MHHWDKLNKELKSQVKGEISGAISFWKKLPGISNLTHPSTFYTVGHDNIADFYASMEWWMFYSTTVFQNINKYYKILLTILQNYQRKETCLLLLSHEALHLNVNNYIW